MRRARRQVALTAGTFPTLTRAQAQATAEGATRFSMRGSCVIAHRPSKARPGEEALCAIVQQTDGSWRYEGWVS